MAAVIVLVAAIALGLYFRFTRLDGKFFWFDEVHSAACVSGRPVQEIYELYDGTPRPLGDLDSYLHLHQGEPLATTIYALSRGNPENTPLYFTSLRLWAEAFGDSAPTLRAFSALSAIVGGVLLLRLCRELNFSRAATAYAIGWWSLSPFLILYSQEARTYSLLAVMVIAANISLLRAMRLQTWTSWLCYSTAAALGLYTHLFFVTLLVAHTVFVAAVGLFDSPPDERRRLFARFAGAATLSVAALSPWLVVLFRYVRTEDLATILSRRISVFYLFQSWIEGLASLFVDLGLHGDKIARAGNIVISMTVLGGLAWAVSYVGRRAPRRTALFLLTTGSLPPLLFIIYDFIVGGSRSEVVRYWLPSLISIGLTFSFAFGMACAAGSRRAVAATLALSLAAAGSGAHSAASPTWWNKGGLPSRLDLALLEHEELKARMAEIAATPRSLLVVDDHHFTPFILLTMSVIADPHIEWVGIAEPELFQPPSDRSIYVYHAPKLVERFIEQGWSNETAESDAPFQRLRRKPTQ